MRAEESKTYSVLELTPRLFAPLFYQFVRPKLVALLSKLRKVLLDFMYNLGLTLQHDLFPVQTGHDYRALLKFELLADLGW